MRYANDTIPYYWKCDQKDKQGILSSALIAYRTDVGVGDFILALAKTDNSPGKLFKHVSHFQTITAHNKIITGEQKFKLTNSNPQVITCKTIIVIELRSHNSIAETCGLY